MRAATERLANVVSVGAHIKAFAAKHTEIDLGPGNSIDIVTRDMHQARFALDHFSLACQFIERYAAVFFRGNHWWQLIEITAKFFKCSPHLVLIKWRHAPFLDNFSFSILCSRADSERERPRVFLVLAHEEILHLGSTSDRYQKQTGRDRIECSAMPDFFDAKTSANECHHIMRSHAFGFVHEQNTVKSRTQ